VRDRVEQYSALLVQREEASMSPMLAAWLFTLVIYLWGWR
jgi:hypothetical protein